MYNKKHTFLFKIFWLLIYCYYCHHVVAKKSENYSVKLTSIFCGDIDSRYVRNVTCYIKAVRAKLGVFYQHWDFDVDACYRMFHKNHAGQFLPYILDMCVDLCQFKGLYTNGNPIIKLIMTLAIKYDTALEKGCPLNGVIDYKGEELDSYLGDYFPPIIPAGDYRATVRLYDPVTNNTLFTNKIYATVSAKRGLDLSMLNMG